MRYLIIIFTVISLYGCTYFEVRDAMEQANKGNYVLSIQNLSNILKNDNSDRRTLDAFELIYPDAEKRFYDEIDANKGYNLALYTKSMINLMKIQDIYFNLPEASKKQMSLISPPLTERNELKKEIALSFFKLGNAVTQDNYINKLKAYGYYNQAKTYNLLNDKQINDTFSKIQNKVKGKFLVNIKNDTFNSYLSTQIKSLIEDDIAKYPLFSIGTVTDHNVNIDITISNFNYLHPNTEVKKGKDSYTDTEEYTIMKKIEETKTVDGRQITISKWVPETKYKDVEIYYTFEKYTKKTSLSYDIYYVIKESNGTLITQGNKKIVAKDEVHWTKYYPYNMYSVIDSFKFPQSENEKYTLSEKQLVDRSIEVTNKELKNIIKSIYANTEPKL